MNIQYEQRDITTVPLGVIGHGCNTLGVMGAGVALAIKQKWPKVYQRYQEVCTGCKNDREILLGSVLILPADSKTSSLYVANMFTQLDYGRERKQYADVDAIQRSLEHTLKFCSANLLPLYLPRIGCGLGGLSWESDVHPVIQSLSKQFDDVIITICDL